MGKWTITAGMCNDLPVHAVEAAQQYGWVTLAQLGDVLVRGHRSGEQRLLALGVRNTIMSR